jgi:hypothetical protein
MPRASRIIWRSNLRTTTGPSVAAWSKSYWPEAKIASLADSASLAIAPVRGGDEGENVIHLLARGEIKR